MSLFQNHSLVFQTHLKHLFFIEISLDQLFLEFLLIKKLPFVSQRYKSYMEDSVKSFR